MTKHPVLLAIAFTMLQSAPARGQEQKPMQLELDAVIGYTAVDVSRWSGFIRVDQSSRFASGAAARLLLTYISNTRVGVEIGTERLFTYTVSGQSGTQITREEHTIAGAHVMVFGRFAERDRTSLDLGVGFHFLGEVSAPGVLASLNHVIVRRPAFSIPVGVRLNAVLNDPAPALLGAAKAGISIPLGGR